MNARMNTGWVTGWVVGTATVVGATAALGGTGTVRESNGIKFLDFCVSVQFNASPAQIQKIEDAFEGGSAILADMTDGQMRFGNVSILDNSAGCSEAEVWIHPGEDRALATFGHYGVRGMHINMYYISNFDKSPDYPLEAYTYTVAHEFGHHLWGLRDEYSGIGCCIDTSADPCPPMADVCDCESFPGSMTANFCAMDNYFRRGGNTGSDWSLDPPSFGTFTLNDLCVASNHDPDNDTFQEVELGESCWETIATHPRRPLTPPVMLPTSLPPIVAPPTFDTLAGSSRFALAVDRSGSMMAMDVGDSATRLQRAIQGAHVFINIARNGDRLGIVSYSSTATETYPLTILDDDIRTEAKDSMNGLMPDGSTAIGLAIQEAQGMIAPLPDSCNQPIILCTDGFGNTGPDELTLIPDLLDDRIPVTTIAIGGAVNEADLMELSSKTGGRYWHVDTESEISAIYAWVAADETCQSVIDDVGGEIPDPGFAEPGSFIYTIPVDDLTTQVSFVVTWLEADADLTLLLIAPNGMTITKSLAIASPDMDWYDGLSQEVFKIRRTATFPIQGNWTVHVIQEGPNGTAFRLITISDTPNYSLNLNLDRPGYACGAPIVLQAVPQFQGRPLAGAAVMAEFTTPAGGMGSLTLQDNGTAANGDSVAGDGVYSAIFGGTTLPGVYSFRATASNINGTTAPGEALFAELGAPATSLTAPPFTRMARAYAVVTGCAVGACCGTSMCFNGVAGPIPCAQLGGSFAGFDTVCQHIDCSNPPCTTSLGCHDGNACTCDGCGDPGGVGCTHPQKRFWGDADCDLGTATDLDDILCTLRGFSGYESCPDGDIHPPCVGNMSINLDDLLAILSAFTGVDPCHCAQ